MRPAQERLTTAATEYEGLNEDMTSVSQIKKQRFYECVDQEEFF